jgi:hypothetical protein
MSTFNRFRANDTNSVVDGENLTVTADMIGQGLLTFICQANNIVQNSTHVVETEITFVTGLAFFCSASQLSHIKPNTCLPTQINSTQLNWTVSKHVLEISFSHVCKTQLNSTEVFRHVLN